MTKQKNRKKPPFARKNERGSLYYMDFLTEDLFNNLTKKTTIGILKEVKKERGFEKNDLSN
jgi:hypothetical protein